MLKKLSNGRKKLMNYYTSRNIGVLLISKIKKESVILIVYIEQQTDESTEIVVMSQNLENDMEIRYTKDEPEE